MPSKKDVHTVSKPGHTGWVNKVGGEVASQHRLKETAGEAGRQIARQNHSEHLIHNLDGQIGRRNSYGNDPNPPKDKNR